MSDLKTTPEKDFWLEQAIRVLAASSGSSTQVEATLHGILLN